MLFPQTREQVQYNGTCHVILTYVTIYQVGRVVSTVLFGSKEAFRCFKGGRFPQFFNLRALYRYFFLSLFRILFRLYTPSSVTIIRAGRV